MSSDPFHLDLPARAVPDRVSLKARVEGGERRTLAELEGPGCIRHIFLVLNHPQHSPKASRRAILRIFFDHHEVPHVEAPVGDFFGVMHGESYYDIDGEFLSVKAWNGYNCYFPMPFASHARIEVEAAPGGSMAYVQANWHRYPGATLAEPRRFCARWRREMPTRRYADDYLLLDADGPGQLIGFAYGVRLLDSVDRWSHGGADNIYIDGEGAQPAYLRGIGGEDCFGCGYGGNLHPPDSHRYEGIPFYTHDDQGMARPAPRLAAYRFFVADSITFEQSLQLRFGCMENDLCSTAWWYQEAPVRPFFAMPDFDRILTTAELPAGTCDLALPDCGSWAVAAPLPAGQPGASVLAGIDAGALEWTVRRAHHGFVDFNHVSRPEQRGAGVHHRGVVGLARAVFHLPTAGELSLRLGWDDDLVLHVNDDPPRHLGHHPAWRAEDLALTLPAGEHRVTVQLSNESGSNHGGWAFACACRTPDGRLLHPRPPG